MKSTESAERGEQKLLAAVVALAVRDSCLAPIKSSERKCYVMQANAYTAFRFLFDEESSGLDAYADWLDFDKVQFRKQLLDLMYRKDQQPINGFDSTHRRSFRSNHLLWIQMRSCGDDLVEANDEE
jgi:hypothetical protein